MRTQFAEMGISVDEGIRYHPEAIEFSTEIGLLADSVQENIDEVGADKVAVIILSFSEITPVMQAADQYDHLSQVLWMGTDTIINDTEFEEDPIAQRFVDRSGLVVASWAPSDNPIADKVNQDAANISGRQPKHIRHGGVRRSLGNRPVNTGVRVHGVGRRGVSTARRTCGLRRRAWQDHPK